MLNTAYETGKASVSVNGVRFALNDTLNEAKIKYKRLVNSDIKIGIGLHCNQIHNANSGITYLDMTIYGLDFMKLKFKGSKRKTANGWVNCDYLIGIEVDAMKWAKGMCSGLGLAHWIVAEALKNSSKDKLDRISNTEITKRLFCIKYDNCGLLTSRHLYNKMYERDVSSSTEKEKCAMMLTFENHEGEFEYEYCVVGETCPENKRAINRIKMDFYYVINKCGNYRIF